MNAPRHINYVPDNPDVVAPVQPLTQIVKIAEILANPVRFFHPDHTALVSGGLQQEQLEGLCKTDEIGKRLNVALADRMSISALDLHPAVIANPQISNVCDLIIAPYAAIEAFLRQVTAVRLQQAIRNCVLKADRERVQAVLGEAAYNTALREAPYFYADMGDSSQSTYFAKDQDIATPVLGVGATMAHSYIATIDDSLAQIFAWRLPKDFIESDVPFDAAQFKSFSRLLAAKGPQTKPGRA